MDSCLSAPTHARTHAHTHARTHMRTRTKSIRAPTRRARTRCCHDARPASPLSPWQHSQSLWTVQVRPPPQPPTRRYSSRRLQRVRWGRKRTSQRYRPCRRRALRSRRQRSFRCVKPYRLCWASASSFQSSTPREGVWSATMCGLLDWALCPVGGIRAATRCIHSSIHSARINSSMIHDAAMPLRTIKHNTTQLLPDTLHACRAARQQP
jgi:hypothetical protein